MAVVGNPIPRSKQSRIVKAIKIITLSPAIDSITKIKFVLKPVDPTAPTITPAVAIATPTAIILNAPFSNPIIVSLYQSFKFALKDVSFGDLINLFIKLTITNAMVA